MEKYIFNISSCFFIAFLIWFRRAQSPSNRMASGLHGSMFTYSAAAWRAKASSLHAEQAVKRKARQHQMSY